jgi:hypothetical protein
LTAKCPWYGVGVSQLLLTRMVPICGGRQARRAEVRERTQRSSPTRLAEGTRREGSRYKADASPAGTENRMQDGDSSIGAEGGRTHMGAQMGTTMKTWGRGNIRARVKERQGDREPSMQRSLQANVAATASPSARLLLLPRSHILRTVVSPRVV